MEHDRYFTNDMKNYDNNSSLVQVNTLHPRSKEKLQKILDNILNTIASSDLVSEKRDISVYTGRSGLALLYFHLYKLNDEKRYLEEAEKHISFCLKNLKGRRVTFLCGDSGPLAIGAVIYNEYDQTDKVKNCIKNLLEFLPQILDLDSELPDEMLYGRSGYLYALLMVNLFVKEQFQIPNDTIIKVWKAILDSGEKGANTMSDLPLMYSWHGKKYIGAAHGISGILYTLLQVENSDTRSYIHSHVLPTIDYVLDLQFSSGNFPSSLNSDNDRLMHWCHGAPGVVHLMIAAYKTFKSEKYLKSAQKCCQIIWKKGLLKKGYGICHGPAGNGYAFLAMFNETKDIKYLHRAVQFGLWCGEYKDRAGVTVPDRPYSLFEGLAGTAYFIADIIYHEQAKFPAFSF